MAAFCDHRLEPSHDSVCAATDEARENDDKMTSIKKKKKKKKKKLCQTPREALMLTSKGHGKGEIREDSVRQTTTSIFPVRVV